MYQDRDDLVKQERQEYSQWHKELFAQIMEYQATIGDKNKTIQEKEEAAALLETKLNAAKTLHLN